MKVINIFVLDIHQWNQWLNYKKSTCSWTQKKKKYRKNPFGFLLSWTCQKSQYADGESNKIALDKKKAVTEWKFNTY